jgi:TRAP transporter TAXI family solute receptor
MWDALKVYGPLALLVIAGFAVAAHFIRPAPPSSIRMATGSPGGVYFALGEKYKQALAKEGIEVELVETRGSMANLALLTTEKEGVDVAFMQGGIGSKVDAPDLVSLGSLYPEALWMFEREDRRPANPREIKGYRIAIGEEGSGSSVLAEDILSKIGMDEDAVQRIYIGGEAAAEALLAGEVDAVAYVSGGRSTIIHELLASEEISLRPFSRAEAFARLNKFLTVETLPEGIIDFKRNIPPQTVPMLATTANLVARNDLHPAIQSLLLQAAHEIQGGGGLFSAPGEFPSPRFVDFPLSEQAERYYEKGPGFLQRYLPFWAANLVQRMVVLLIPLATLLLPFFKVAPPLYQWQVRRRIYKWYDKIRAIEATARDDSSESGNAKSIAALDKLQADVGALKVPLGYSEQLFQLRLHIGFVRQMIESGEFAAEARVFDGPESASP